MDPPTCDAREGRDRTNRLRQDVHAARLPAEVNVVCPLDTALRSPAPQAGIDRSDRKVVSPMLIYWRPCRPVRSLLVSACCRTHALIGVRVGRRARPLAHRLQRCRATQGRRACFESEMPAVPLARGHEGDTKWQNSSSSDSNRTGIARRRYRIPSPAKLPYIRGDDVSPPPGGYTGAVRRSGAGHPCRTAGRAPSEP